jgi:RNA recognition motif-containing protein
MILLRTSIHIHCKKSFVPQTFFVAQGVSLQQVSVRPAIVDGSLWVGGLPETATNDTLRAAISCLGLGEPESSTLARDTLNLRQRKKSWGIIKFKTDEDAANVLVKSWETVLATSALAWPVHIEAWAPGEDNIDKFLLELPNTKIKMPAPSHFVMTNSLEWELCNEWRQLAMHHRAQKESLKETHFIERHKLMEEKTEDENKAKWSLAKSESTTHLTRTRRTIFVMDVDSRKSKEDVMNFFSQFGQVQGVTLQGDGSQEIRNARVTFADIFSARKARKKLPNTPETPIGCIRVRPFLENPILWVCDIGTGTTNQVFKESFEQFGNVKHAILATNSLTNKELSFGALHLQHHSVASAVLDVMDFDIFVISGSSRPIHVEPFIKSDKIWHASSPAGSLMRSESWDNVRVITPTDELFETFLAARELQVKQRCESKQLKQLQLRERVRIEENQKARVYEEYKKTVKLEEFLEKLLAKKDSKSAFQSTLQADASRKRPHSEFHGGGGAFRDAKVQRTGQQQQQQQQQHASNKSQGPC